MPPNTTLPAVLIKPPQGGDRTLCSHLIAPLFGSIAIALPQLSSGANRGGRPPPPRPNSTVAVGPSGLSSVVGICTGVPVYARLSSRAPLVTHVHGFPSDWIPEVRGRTRELRRRIEALAGESSAIVASSPWLARILEECGYGGSVTILPYGVSLDAPDDTRIDAMRAGFGLSPDNIVVGFVGRLVAHKGVRHVFDAAARLANETRVVFVIAGDGPLRNEVEQQARSHTNVKFVGPQEAGAGLMFAFDIAVVPSDWEPFGIVSLEAMAANKPVVAFRVDGIPDVVVDGTTGLLVNHGDVVALADAIRALANDPHLRTRLGTAGATRVAEKFTSRHAAQALLEYYRESIDGPKRNKSRS